MHVSQKNGEMDSMINNTQQSFSQVSSPARSEAVVEKHKHKPVLNNPNTQIQFSTGTLQYHKDRFAKGHKCICPKRFVIPVRAYNTDYVEQQCQICQNTFGKVYD